MTEEAYRIKLVFNPRTENYDLCECDKCGAFVLPQSYPRHVKTKKHLDAKTAIPLKNVGEVNPHGRVMPFKVERGNFSIRF